VLIAASRKLIKPTLSGLENSRVVCATERKLIASLIIMRLHVSIRLFQSERQ
jgi:hypothetical protein